MVVVPTAEPPRTAPRRTAPVALSAVFAAGVLGSLLVALFWPAANRQAQRDLHGAVRRGELDTVVALVRSGAGLDEPDDQSFTPLFVAALEDRPQIAQVLLKAGADPGRTDRLGATALHRACEFGYAGVARLLIAGASPEVLTAPDDGGRTPRDYAVASGSAEILAALDRAHRRLDLAAP